MKHFFDIGANAGNTFERFLLKTNEFDGQRVWCFEPSPQSWAQLQKVAEQMSKRFKITLCPFGIGLMGAFPFYRQQESEGDSFIPDSVAYTGVPAIPASLNHAMLAIQYPLSMFILKHTFSTDKITLKLDCEGSEFVILKDLIRSEALKRCERILVEWHNVRTIDHQEERENLEFDFKELGHPLEIWPY